MRILLFKQICHFFVAIFADEKLVKNVQEFRQFNYITIKRVLLARLL